MRHKTTYIITVLAVVALLISAMAGACTKHKERALDETHYMLDNCVVVHGYETLITVEDERGNLWRYEAEGDNVPQVGSRVSMLMDNNGTEDTINDDAIVVVLQDNTIIGDFWRDRK